jgi:rhamnulokinase
VVDDAGFEAGVTNEGGVNNTIRLLKNIMGLWLVQECKRQWQRDGRDFSYAQLTEMAARARPFAVRISPDEGEFLYHGDMPAKINNVLRRTGQAELSDRGEFVRVILESLAFTYRRTLDRIEALTGRKIKTLHIVGGGTQNELLNQFAANATGREVVAGPVEATSIGNVLTQARATGQIRSFAELRSVVRQSFPTKTYWPKEREDWEAEYARREARTS